MSRIDDLIAELCPDGVQFIPLDSLVSYAQPTKYLVESTNYDDSFGTPVLTAGQTFVLGHTDETTGIYAASREVPVVIFDDFTTAFKWVDFPFKAKSSAMKMLSPRDTELASLRYIYFVMQTIRYKPEDHARQWIGTYSKFLVPVPPLEVQHEIVRILDQFTQLEAELEAELEARARQYQHYRREILDQVVAPRVTLADLGFWGGGMTPSKQNLAFWEGGSVPWLASMDVSDESTNEIRGQVTALALRETPLKVLPRPSIPVVMRSNILRRTLPIGFVDIDTTVNQDVRALVVGEGIDARYVYQVLRADSERIRERCVRTDGSMAAVNSKAFFAWLVPLPPMDEQRRIAASLDDFDLLVNDLSIGLPAELAARRKQYEHYRDRLLTFKEAA